MNQVAIPLLIAHAPLPKIYSQELHNNLFRHPYTETEIPKNIETNVRAD